MRIRVRNIRSVADGEITITPDGITALHGPVGSGKSTILDALVWVLYGEVPAGLKQAEMRRTGADGQPCEAEVEFIYNGQTYTALRGLRQRKFKGGVREEAYARWWTCGAHGADQAERQISPTKLTQKITELTGLSGRAYTGAFFIAQGQLPTLAEGTPAQVQQIFEEQTGLGTLTKKVDEAHAAARAAHERAVALPGSREETDQARTALDTAQQAAATAYDEHHRAAETASQAADRLQKAEQQLDALQQRRRAADQARIWRARVEERLHSCQQRVETLTAQIPQLGPDDASVDDLSRQLQVLREALSAAQHARAQATEAKQRLTDAEARVTIAQEQADVVAHPELDRRIEAAAQQKDEFEQQVGALKSDYRRLNLALKTLQAAGAAACCPTCAQPVRNLRALAGSLDTQVQRCIADGRTAAVKADAAAQLHTALLATRGKRTQAAARLTAARGEAAAERRRAAAAEKTSTDRATTLLAHLPQAGTTDADSTLRRAQKHIDDHAARLTRAQHLQGLREQLHAARTELDSARAARDQLPHEHADVDDAQLAAAAEHLASVRAEHSALSTTASEANTRFRVSAERVTVLQDAHTAAKDRMKLKAAQLHKAEILHQAASVLAALRRDLLAEYTAAVSQAATDVLTQLTSRHVQFEIDETFAPRVRTAEGTVRPTRVLSGGEKATAALAFRLGITTQITGGNATGMIIADEITAAHDADTRQAVMTCLTELGWPALVVSHAEEITETAQHVITLTQPNETTGTVISAAA